MKELIILKEPTNKISNPRDLFNKIKKINIDYECENLIVFFLNRVNKIVYKDVIFKGGWDECTIDPRPLFKKALLKNACSVIIAHNHPSKNLSPSKADLDSFNDLKKAGELINISVLDSLIFCKDSFYSIGSQGDI